MWIYDIETLINCFVVCFKNVSTKERKVFVIWKDVDDYNELIDFLKNKVTLLIGFNNLGFDAQVIRKMFDKKLSANQIYKVAQSIITNQSKYPNYNDLKVTNLDLFKIWHFDNDAKRTSLKWIQFSIDWEDLREMPISHDTVIETKQQVDDIIYYCMNDVDSTEALYEYTMGRTDHPLYKGINKLSLRGDIYEEFKIDCFNYNDVKIGEEIIKTNYIATTNVEKQELKNLTKESNDFTFGDCFPDYYSFKTKHFNDYFDKLKHVKVELDEKQVFTFKVDYLTLTIAKGGLHSEDSPRWFISNNRYLLRDADVGSMYPNAIRKRRLFPRHLGEPWLGIYSSIIQKRIGAKKKFKETKDGKYKAIDEAFKLALNGGSFGKMGETFNWQYDPFSMNCVTIGSQIDLLMLIEDLMLNDIYVVSANTDGVLCYLDREKEELYNKICSDWEKKVGNDTMGNLEYQDFTMFAQTSVNDYIAIKPDGKAKTKGDFVSELELHKNKSRKVVAIALQEYFKNNIPLEDTIRNHKNIYDFCCAVRANKEDNLVVRDIMTQDEYTEQRTVRYYISNTDKVLLKRMKPLNKKKPTFQIDIFGNIEDGTRQSQIEAGWNIEVFNRYVKKDDYNIDYNYYIEKAYRILNQIEKIELNQIKL